MIQRLTSGYPMTIRRIHPVYWMGTLLFLLAFGRVFLMEWEALAVGGPADRGAFLPEGTG